MDELEYLDEDLAKNGTYYQSDYPASLSSAIYYYGDFEIKDILCYIEGDEDHGVILTPDILYYSLNEKNKVSIKDIHHLSYKPEAYIKINDVRIESDLIDYNAFIHLLNEMTDIRIDYLLNECEKIEYFSTIVLNDLVNDVYEDMNLSNDDYMKIKEFNEDLSIIKNYSDPYKTEEFHRYNNQILKFFDELALDSEEIDELLRIQRIYQDLEEKRMNEFDQMVDGLRNGNPEMKQKLNSAASMLGIDLNDLQNKSPEELNHMVDDLCERFNISKDQLETLAKRFGK